MKKEDVKIGMKVVIHAKSAGKPMALSSICDKMKEKKQPFLYVSHQHADERGGSRFMLSDDRSDVHCCGDYFMCTDFEPYTGGLIGLNISSMSESYRNIYEFIKAYNYTYDVRDIIDSYRNQYLKHYYTSYTMGICIENNMSEIKHLVKVLKKRDKRSRKQRRRDSKCLKIK